MPSQHIATTRLRDLQPLASAGQTPTEAWAVLSALLSRELSPAHAALLAEPVENAARGETDWYAEGDGPAVPLQTLDGRAREAAEARLAALIGDIERLAASRRAAGPPAERFLGELLTSATRVPDLEWVRVMNSGAGPQPVLVAWGHRRAGPRATAVELTGRANRPLAPMTLLPPPRVPVPVSALRRWLPAALTAGLLLPLLALLILVFDPFRWFIAPVPNCAVPDDQMGLLADLRAANEQELLLRARLADLETEVGRRRRQCPPVHVSGQQGAAGDHASGSSAGGPSGTGQSGTGQSALGPGGSAAEDQRRAEQRGATTGKLEVTLAWEDRNDLDLHVRCATGEIYYKQRDACGGQFDVDANSNARTASDTPVEHVAFANPTPGHYDVIVDAYSMRVGTSSRFRVTISRDGRPERVVEGTATQGQGLQIVAGVDVPAP